MKPGITDPSDARFDSLADWYAEGDVLEIRIPWMMLGNTDPSSLRVWNYPYEVNGIEDVRNDELRIYPTVRSGGETQPVDIEPARLLLEGLGRAYLPRAEQGELRDSEESL